MDEETILRRRQQSDRASAEIGNRLLKGWAMLADECPGPECYGVPLIRPPKPGGGKDPRKECVICGSIYVDGRDLGDLDHPASQPRAISTEKHVHGNGDVENVDSLDLAESKSGITHPPAATQPTASTYTNMPQTRSDSRPQGLPSTHLFTQAQHTGIRSDPSTTSALEAAELALKTSLRVLADRLNLSAASGASMDPRSVGDLAGAIQKVTTALISVRSARQSERLIA